MGLIVAYILANVLANLTATWFGVWVTPINAFVLISLTLTSRDQLHERWAARGVLWRNMLFLIGTAGVLSILLNLDAAQIAQASFITFVVSGLSDTLVYKMLGDKSYLVKVNGSNVISAGVDSVLFPLLAFGLPILPGVVLLQFVAKVGGGFLWSIILRWWGTRQNGEQRLAAVGD